MNRKVLGLLLGLFLYAHVHAQVSMTLQLPPTGVMQKNQLWNLLLVNSGSATVTVRLQLVLLSTANNQPVMTGATRSIQLAKGAKQLKYDDLSPVQYEYPSALFSGDLSPNGLLPIGNYTACYTAYQQVGEDNVILAEDCVPLEIAPLQPPLLNTPFNEAVVETAYPQFTWLPPTPLQLFTDLSYDFILVKQQAGQSASQALQQNIPMLSQSYLRNPFLNYPASNAALDTGVTYCWGIVARNNGQLVANSEAWTFKLTQKAVIAKEAKGPYLQLKSVVESAYASCNGTLSIEYNHAYKDSLVQYEFVNISGGNNKVIRTGQLEVAYGQNFLVLPDLGSLLDDKAIYIFKIKDRSDGEWQVKFQYNKPANN